MDAFEVVSVNSANAIGKPSQVHLLGKLEALYHAPVAADVVAARDRGRRPVLSNKGRRGGSGCISANSFDRLCACCPFCSRCTLCFSCRC